MIISPWIFYLISLASNLSSFAMVGLIIGIAMIILLFIFSLSDENYSSFKKEIRTGIIITVICGLILIFIPSETVCYEMLAASYLTEDNISKVGNTAEDVVNYIIEQIKDFQESD